MIPFSPPHIDEDMIKEVVDTLRSGWITSGPKVRQFEEAIGKYISVDHVLCVNAATSGLELILRWYGIGKGDEVIVPAYTYCATANVILHCGATPVMVDVNSDFNMDMKSLRKTITPNTKAIIPVDIAGLPCDYDELFDIIGEQDIADLFQATTSEQKALGRVLILADAAHSLGAVYKGKRSGTLADISVFSFHAVKNLTTAEGGAICLHLTKSFDNKVVKEKLRILSLHGQNKDALAKTLSNNWEYDVMEAGYKYNMTDISAAIGLVGLAKYDTQILKRRREIFERYNEGFGDFDWAEVPVSQTEDKLSSFSCVPLKDKVNL